MPECDRRTDKHAAHSQVAHTQGARQEWIGENDAGNSRGKSIKVLTEELNFRSHLLQRT